MLQCVRVKWYQKALKQTILHPQKHISSIKQEKPSKVIKIDNNEVDTDQLQSISHNQPKSEIRHNQTRIQTIQNSKRHSIKA